MQSLFIILGIYLLYTFIADFAIPVYKTSRRMHAQFKNMQQQGSNAASQPGPNPFKGASNGQSTTPPKPASKDYIDFEEIKD